MSEPLTINARWTIPAEELSLAFARSSGPGGQNVNKVNSKAALRWSPVRSTALPDEVRERFLVQFASRLTVDGEVLVTSERFRDQRKNIEDCREKLREMVLSVAAAPKPRKARRVSRAAKARRLEQKRVQSRKKQGRSGKFDD